MKKKYDSLKEMAASPCRISGLKAGSQQLMMINNILTDGKTYTVYCTSGWYPKYVDLTEFVSDYLTKMRIYHIVGNDAPRGGKLGTFVQVTSPAFLRDVKKVQAIRKQEELMEKMMEEERRKRRAERKKRRRERKKNREPD